MPRGRLAVVALPNPRLADVAAERRAGPETAAAMLDAALSAFPAERVVVLAPSRTARRLRSQLEAARARGVTVIERACDPWSLLDRAERVYSLGGEIGFLGAARRRAGDRLRRRSLYRLGGHRRRRRGAAARLPPLGRRNFRRHLPRRDALPRSVPQRRDRLSRRRWRSSPSGAGSRPRTAASRCASGCRSGSGGGSPISCARRPARRYSAAPSRGRAGGGARASRATQETARSRAGRRACRQGLAEAAAAAGVTLIRVEDGFIRSVGLGSDFLPPASLVFDASGMYFDPRGGSDLECLLRDSDFSPGLARPRRAAQANGSSNAASPNTIWRRRPPGDPIAGIRRDAAASWCRGRSRTICRSASAPARCAPISACWRGCAPPNPDAFIVYKPHPDVVAGHRIGAVPEAEARRFADLVVVGRLDRPAAGRQPRSAHDDLARRVRGAAARASGRRLRPAVLRRLGADRRTCRRFDRGRRLSLDQLVAGALILYPRYLDPLTRLPCGPEILIERLEQPGIVAGRAAGARAAAAGVLSRRLAEAARDAAAVCARAIAPRTARLRAAAAAPDAGAVPGRSRLPARRAVSARRWPWPMPGRGSCSG